MEQGEQANLFENLIAIEGDNDFRHRRTIEYRKEQKQQAKIKRADYIMNRPFIAWDGEGWEEDGVHNYKFLANSLGDIITASNGCSLSSLEVFELFMDVRNRVPDAFNVVFGGNYDFNCIVRGNGLPFSRACELYATGNTYISGYSVKLMPSRLLQVGETSMLKDDWEERRFILYDVFSFFQKSFVDALDEYFPDGWEGRDLIVEMKQKRRDFEYESMQKKIDYNFLELKNLVRLMDELRQRLYDAGVLVSRWYGPGAIATKVLQSRRIKECMDQDTSLQNDSFGHAVRAAYSGGRFEVIKCGYSNAPVYEYDINSAYPFAMTKLPNLAHGEWVHYDEFPGWHHFGLYHVVAKCHASIDEHEEPFPLFRRDEHNAINYPSAVSGWYWTPEAEVSSRHPNLYDWKIDEAWIFHEEDTNDRPFAFLHDMYRQRQLLKKIGSGAHIGLKLAMNSMYGKMAQQIGWRDEGKTLRLPPFHQLEWAGYVTSHCRAQVLDAVLENLSHVIAFETDAVFMDVPMDNIRTGKGLGEWETTEFSDMLYIQSGMHWGTIIGGSIEPRTRGISDRILSRKSVMEKLLIPGGFRDIEVPDSRFVTLSLAVNQDYRKWCQWIDATKKISAMLFDANGKRDHVEPAHCPACGNKNYEKDGAVPIITLGTWHHTWVCDLRFDDYENKEHELAWLMPKKDRLKEILRRKKQYDEDQLELTLI